MICNGFDNHTKVHTDLMIIKIVNVNIVDIECQSDTNQL